MEENYKKTSFDGIAIPDRPINIDSYLIYGVLYNTSEDITGIHDYMDYLVAVEQFEKNGGSISEITKHLIKGKVSVQTLEYDDYIEVLDGEIDDDDPRIILSETLIDRYVSRLQTTQVKRDK